MNRQIAILLLVMTALLAFTGTAVAEDLIIGSGETYTIGSGETYVIQSYEWLTIEDGGILVIESGAQLVNHYGLKNYGTINNYGDINSYNGMWNYGTINNYGNFTNTFSTVLNYGLFNNEGNINNDGTIMAFAPLSGNDVGGGFVTPTLIADAGGPYTGTVNEPITFDASGSSSAYGTIVSYAWWFGEGGMEENVNSPTITHTFASAGEYIVGLSYVMDENGYTSWPGDQTTVTVTESPVPNPDQSIPEFPIIALPIAAILGLAFIFRKRE